jgi:ribosome-associated toxin RatA of RatAB toxin-antitoxin module
MRQVTMRFTALDHDAAESYRRITDFARYPELTTAVREVGVHPPDADGSVVSEWTVYFRNGLLRWTERDAFDHATRTITFEQLSGDFETFTGGWAVAENAGGAVITFDATFDLGIPSLADILEPVAEATLRSNILTILRGLLGTVEREDPAPVGGPA